MVTSQIYGIAPTSVIVRVKLLNSSVTTGAGLSGLTSASSGLVISTIQSGEISATTYTAAAGTIESIASLGTYAAPTATKCRFKEVDATNLPGIYELQFANSRFVNGMNPLTLLIAINGAANLAQKDIEIQCKDLYVDVREVGGSSIAAVNLSANYAQTSLPTQLPYCAMYLADCVDYQRGHHTQTGRTYYVDGLDGNDSTGNGTRITPYKTISKALTQVITSNHDQIILLPCSGGNPTTITETGTINIGKNYVQIRGPGRDVRVTNTSNTDVFNISANGVGLGGFRVATAGGTANGVTVTSGDFILCERLWIENAHRDAISLTLANRAEISNCVLTSAARDGIRINTGSGAGYNTKIIDNVIRNNVGVGINLLGVDASYARAQKNNIRNNGTGINIAADTLDSLVSDNRIAGNTVQYVNNGTSTYEQWDWLNTDQNGSVITNSVSTGAAINQNASSWLSLSSPVASTETGGVQNTVARNGVYDVITNASQAQDSYYEFSIGGTGVPTSLSIYAAVQNGSKTVAVYGYNWAGSSWIQIGTMTGTAGLTLVQYSMAMYTSMVGTGTNAGKVRIRFLSNAAATTVTVDQLYVQYTVTSQSIGYVDGAIWIDGVSGTAGTSLYVNGTADNPVLSYSDALTLANALHVKRFHLSPDTTIVLTQNHDYWTFKGQGYINLNGQSINDVVFESIEHLTGTSTGKDSRFTDCIVGDCTLDSCVMIDCNYDGTMTTVTSGNYTIRGGIDAIPGLLNPTIVCKPYANYGLRNWRGGINIDSLVSTNNFYIDGQGRAVLAATISGGNLSIRGSFDILDQVSGGFSSVGTLTDTARWNESQSVATITGSVSGSVNSVVSAVTVGTNLDKTNYTISAGTVTSITSAVTVGTNLDKTNYTISAGTVTSITSAVTVGTNLDKTNYSISGGNVTNVINDVGIAQSAADKVWSSTSRALTDKINFNISGGTLTTNLDKTNYSTSGGTITTVTGDVSITQIAADKVWSSTSRALTDKINFNISGGTLTTNLDKTNYSISGGTVTTISDKTDYSLSISEHNLIKSDASQGVLYTSANKILADGSGYVTVNTVTGNVNGSVNSVTIPVTVGTNNDKTNYWISGTKKTLDSLQDITTAQVNTQVAAALVSYDSNGGVAKENSLLSIQNNTNFVATVPSIMLIPVSGFNVYKTQVLYYSTSGALMDVDGNEMAVNIETATALDQTNHLYKDSACVSACSASPSWPTFRQLVRTATGTYEGYYQVSASEVVGQLLWQFNMKVATVTVSYSRTNLLYSEVPGTTILADNTTNKTIIAESVLLTAANKIKTNASNQVESSSVQGDIVGNVQGSVDSVVNSVDISGSNIITQQQVRDAMTLSATSASMVGSVDRYLTSISASTSAISFTGLYVNAQIKAQDNIDFGASQKTSLNAATPISVGSVTGAVGSVTSPVTVGTNTDKTNYTVISGIINSITGNVGGNVVGNVNGSVGSVVGSVGSVVSAVDINDNSTNKNIIASSMKSQDVTGTSAVTGSIYDDLLDSILSGGVGANLVTFKTTDENGAVVGSVWIGIYNSSSNLIRSTISDDNGLVSGSNSMVLDDGTYSGRFSKSLYSYPVQSLVVSGDTSFTVSGTQYVITSGAVGTQVLYGYVIHGDSTVASGCTVKAELESIGDFANSYLITTKTISTTTTSAGFYQLNLVKGADFRISEVWNGKSYYVKTITISNDATKDISTY